MHTLIRKLGLIAVVAAVSAVALVGPVASAAATAPGANGRIAFMRWDEQGRWQLWTANPDLGAQHQLTDDPYDNGWPNWSPDGSRIAFESARLDPENGDARQVFTMAADGTDIRQVTDFATYSGQPSWSPDGQWIAFTSDGGDYPSSQGIYVIHPDGTGLHRVAALPGGPRTVWLDAPRFSPDGTRIAYTQFEGGKPTPAPWSWKGENSSVWTVGLDGGEPRQIVPLGQKAGDADWSPDGAYLVFEQMGNHPGRMSNVLRVPAEGGGIANLSDDSGLHAWRSPVAFSFEASFDPVYSPDGTKILFPHDSYSPESGCTGLQVMNADGSDRRWVDGECGVEHQVDWGSAPLE